jgi:glycosyltransferase involved in cell wall biosynthesis
MRRRTVIVGVDVRKIRDTGIGTYIQNILREIFQVDGEDRFVLFGHPGDAGCLPIQRQGIEWVACRAGKYSFGEHFALPWLALRHKVEIFHSPHYTLPVLFPGPCVVTIHDLIHVRFPENLPSRFHHMYAVGMARAAAKRARLVITVSDYSRNDIVSHLGIREEKVRVIHNGVAEEYFESSSSGRDRETYLLAVSSLKPHKNLEGTIRAFSIVARRVPNRLVVVCERPEPGSPVWNLIRKEGLEERVEFTGYLDPEALKRAYGGAILLLSLSYYEGFGLPVVEAMASGVPVVLSRISSHPEVAGDAALMVEAGDDKAAAEASLCLIRCPAVRDTYIRRGRERARSFSWREAALKTLECYREAHGGLSRT